MSINPRKKSANGDKYNHKVNKAGTKFARSIHEGTATIRHGKWTAKVRKEK